MAPLSLKIVQDEGAVTRTFKFESTMRVGEAQALVREKILTAHDGKDYGLFLTSADDEKSGVWLEAHRQLDYYVLRDGDQLHYMSRARNLRVRMLDGSVKTLPVDESHTVEQLMVGICGRLGITNHDEYGLCFEGDEDAEESKPAAGTGTLTLKRVTLQRDRDAKLQQLSKKLKTDDHVEWLDQHRTLRELSVDPKRTVLLKRRLFFSDRNVDARDPVQLNLLYVQARDAILEGRHPVTKDQAVEFAGIQCQVHYGDFQEDKHKPGFFENLNEYLPEQYSGSWGVEKEILREFGKHQGLGQLEAKHQYTKTARDLPTYGVTFFLVKEKMKGKKKLVPRLLGINAESILRLDETTKEILQVWPLTQVKTYHAGKAETFTLDFGDYSDKEYSVKTNDAHRIRDILQGYIDIIRKRMEANYNLRHTEHHAICEDNVQADRGHIMTHIEHNSSKVVEETFIGPSKIITYEPGKAIAQGTQIMTVQQMVVTNKGGNQQTVVLGEVPMRKDMSLDFVRKLNRLNSNSVKVVTLLTDPSEHSLSEAAKIIDIMEADMPSITDGVKETANKKTSEEAKKKLLSELQELRDCMKALVDSTDVQHNPEEAQEAAKRIADLSTQMFFSLDPAMQKRGKFCRESRKSFIHDDAVDASLRRASYLTAARGVHGTIHQASADLHQEYQGPLLGAADVEDLEKAAADKMDKLNAAVALYLTAYADPKNTDYAAAVTSINTMNELLPELVKDGKALSSVKVGKNREELLDAIRTLCDAMKNVCLAADPDEHQKMHDDVKEYSKISDRLLFTFRRGRSVDKQNEIIELAKVAGEKASLLLMKANELTGRVPDAEAAMLDDAGVRCADAAQDLITCATLTAPSIHEPHCQSALTAAAEALSSSAQHLAVTWKPLVEDPAQKVFGEDLRDRTMDLAKALDKLKDAFAGLDEEEPNEMRANRRLKFVSSVADAKNRMDAAEAELDAPVAGGPQKQTEEELRRRLAQSMAQLNAALAALVAASADRDKPDYTTAEIAVSTIGELMPDIVKDGKLLSANAGEDGREQMLAELRALCHSTRDIYSSADSGDMDDLNKLATKVGASSGKLCFKFNPHSRRGQEQQILDLASSANDKASQLLDEVKEVVKKMGGQAGTEMETARLKMADAAGALQTAAQLTAPSIQDPRCQACLVSSADALAASSQHLAAAWALQPGLQEAKTLEELRMQLERQLEALKKACQDTGIIGAEEPDDARAAPRLRFVTTVAAAKDKMKAIQAEIDQPVAGGPQKQTEEELRRRLAQKMAQLNAALAALVAASADRSRPDYAAAEQAVAAIADVMPEIVKDGKLLSAGKDDKAGEEMRAELRALCDHAGALCGGSESGDLDDLNRVASTLAASSGKLLFTFKPTAGRAKEQQILAVSSTVNAKASQLLAGVQELAQQVHGPPRTELDAARLKAADAAQGLHITAQLTAPCLPDPRCQATLVSSANALSSSSQQLASHWMPLVMEPRLAHLAKDLEEQRLQLERELDRLKKACVDTDAQPFAEPSQSRELQRLQFLKSVAAAETQLQATENELKKPGVPPRVSPPRLRTRIAALHAAGAVAARAHADRDRENPDYAAADKAINDINQLLPQIVKEAKSQNLDEKARSARVEDLKAMCEAARGLLAAAHTDQDLNDSVVKLATASGKLLGSYDTPAEQDREQRILDLSTSACEKASRLLSGVHQLAAETGGEAGGQLDSDGSQLADRANSLLTTAQITAPCFEDAECRSILQSSTGSVQEASKRLAFTWKPLVQDPRFQSLGADLERAHQELENELEELKKACQLDDCGLPPPEDESPLQKQRRLEFTRTAAAAGDNLLQAVKDLDKPTLPQGVPPPHLQGNLARSLAQLNAAVAALLTATHDPAKPDYDSAEQAIHQINVLMPQVVKDTKTLSANKDPEVRDAMLFDVKAMCEAAQGVCQAAANRNKQLSTKHVASFANCSGKLSHVVSPPAAANLVKEREIMELSASVGAFVAGLVSGLQPLEAQAQAPAGLAGRLQTARTAAAGAAHALNDNAKLTAANIQDPCCRATLLSSIAAVSSSAQTLAGLWTPITQEPRHAALRLQLNKEKKGLEEAVEKLKAAVLDVGPGAKSPMRKAPPLPPKRASAHDMPQAHAHADHRAKRDFNQEFLDQMRLDETRAANEAALAAEAQKKKEAERQLVAAVDSAVQRIQKAEDHITKVYSSTGEVIPGVPAEQALALQKKVEVRLAASALAARDLLANDQSDFDYAAASKATTALSEQMPNIVKDAISLRGAMTEGESKLFLEDVLATCDAAKVLVGAAKHDHKRITESAIAFGNKSAKILYVVSTDIDPAQTKEVLSLVRSVGDGAGHLSARGEASPSHPVAGAAAELADAAGTLIYSAKLLAPTIQIPECSQSLIHASEDVAQKLHKYTTTFETLEKVDPQASATFSSESTKLEGLLRSLQEDLRSGKLVKRRVVERVVEEDTPLRQLACRIIEDAKIRAETTSFPESQRRQWAAHANRLTRAAAALGRACHAARRAPADANKHLALENAVQELQVLVLMSRPSLDGTQNNIVDLTDYVRAVSDDADILLKECREEQPELQMVKEHCERIKDNAARVMNPYLQSPVDAPEDDRGDVAQFAEDCEKRMRTINSIIQELKDSKTKIDLHEKAARLVETTNLLNFATQSDVATTRSVALDAALEELEDLKTGLEDMLTAGGTPARKRVPWSDAGSSRLIAAASRGDAGSRSLAPAFAVYLDDMRANRDLSDPDQRQRAKEHLHKVLQLLQTLTMTSGRHVATWQHTNHPETAAITEQIVKELDEYHTECNGDQKSVLKEVDVTALLRPNATKVQVDQKQLPEKLNQAASKLSSSAGMILQSVQRPESLARSLHAAATAATHLAAVAATHPHDKVHSQKINEAAKEMSLQTYNVLKIAEFASQDPNNFASRRKLMDACRLLNDAISQLVKTSLPGQPLQQVCAEALQRLQLQQSALLAVHGAAAAGYGDTLLALASQADVIQKLGDDTPVPRAEFRRSVSHAGAAVARAVECAAHAAYLLSISDQHKDLAAAGFVDAPRIQSLSEAVQDSCHRIISSEIELAEEEAPILTKHVQDFQQAVAEAQDKLKDEEREELKESSSDLDEAIKQLNAVVIERVLNKAKLTTVTFRVVDSVRTAAHCVQRAASAPAAAGAKAGSDDVINNCRNLNTKMVTLIREVRSSEDQEIMTWVTFGASRKAVLDMYEALLNSVRVNGKRAGVIESQSDSEEEMNQAKKSFVQIQLDLANKWLARPTAKAEIATSGEQASRTILSLAEKISEDLKGQEKEEMQHLVTESQQLLTECLKKRDQEKASLLMERLKSLKKAIERGVVSRVVEDFLEGEEPLADLDILADAERDEDKRKFLLERKIAELLAHLGRVTRTARVVAGAGRGGATVSGELLQTSQQTELLAPMLVKAAQKRVASPDDQAAIEHYQKLLAEYAEQLAHMRELCDQAVDPMDFVQTAGETMQRMREDKTYDNNPQMSVYASTAITKLANRVINVSMSSSDVRKDPELQKALREAKERLKAAVPKPNDRPSRILDWKDTTAEILRTTGEVESVLGGEMIFKKQQTSDQPIFTAALDLHTAIRSWSAKDNEIVAVARRMAVLMARLSDYMNTDRKRDVIFTAKSIVTESQEVADLARKLANECTDVRIKTNLLKVCEKIPTISGQLKMLATVKGSLGQQDLKVDQEDMNMLVGNAQNLMLSVQEAVSAAASASVKINSQRGQPRMRWVRNTYY